MKPNIARVSSKTLLSTVVAGIGLFAAFLGFKTRNSLRQPIPQLEFPKQELPDSPGSFYLKNVPTLDDVHLLDGDFKIVRRVNGIPDACMSNFGSSFLTINGLRAKPGEVRFANPGEPFQWSDYIQEELPFRRLEFAGVGTSQCFIHYQMGASAFCLAVIDVANNKIRIGEYHKPARNLNELRQMIFQRRFRDGSGC
jgi:hypothetical protein